MIFWKIRRVPWTSDGRCDSRPTEFAGTRVKIRRAGILLSTDFWMFYPNTGRRPTVLMRCRAIPPFAIVGLALASFSAQPESAIPTPSQFLGINVGGDGVLATYDQIARYWKAIDALSDGTTVEELGQTTLGQPYFVAVITSPENQKRLEDYRAINNRLYDPRKTSDSEGRGLIARRKTIVAIQMGIHSDEIGAPQLSLELAHRFATENTPRIKQSNE